MKLNEIADTEEKKNKKLISALKKWLMERWNDSSGYKASRVRSYKFSIEDGEAVIDAEVNGIKDHISIKTDKLDLPVKIKKIIGNFQVIGAKSLENSPRIITQTFSVHNSDITSLEGCPEDVGAFNVGFCPKLEKIDALPKNVGHTISITSCGIKTLRGLNEVMDPSLYVQLQLDTNPVKEGILSLCFIPKKTILILSSFGISDPDYTKAMEIMKKHVGQGRPGLIDAQQELMDADLDDFATL